MPLSVVLEVAPRRSFASALAWPGWARGGRQPEDALEALVTYGPRYAEVARRAGLRFRVPKNAAELAVEERLTGGTSTEFGIPSLPASSEEAPVSSADLRRLLRLMAAVWETFDAAATGATGARLTKGPRGGGRSLAKIRDHVRDAEIAYIGKLGSKTPEPKRSRETFVAALTAMVEGRPVEHPRATRSLWPARYAVRRAAWHVLDHAWELEDRTP